jgi:hypothetical protein
MQHCKEIRQEHKRRWESSYDNYQKLPGERRTTTYNAAYVGDINSSLKGGKKWQSLRKKYILHKIKQIFYIILKSMGFGVSKSQLSGVMLIERADIGWGEIIFH